MQNQGTQTDLAFATFDDSELRRVNALYFSNVDRSRDVFEIAVADISFVKEKAAGFLRNRDAAQIDADAVRNKMLEAMRSGGPGVKPSAKQRAEMSECMIHIELNQSLADEESKKLPGLSLQAAEAASNYRSDLLTLASVVEKYLADVLISKMPPEFWIYMDVVAKNGGDGLSAIYELSPGITTPTELARHEFFNLVRTWSSGKQVRRGIYAFVPKSPDELSSYIKTPLQIAGLRKQFESIEAAS